MARDAERLGKNEALFREVNERIHEVDRLLDRPGTDRESLWEFICECSNEACFEHVELRPAEYEAVRAHANRFVILPGHELRDIEDVVQRSDRYAVVEKRAGPAGKVARETDPRS